eukprot:TRINITY_DN7481_c3_g1_i2.p3 TRINITY_DN7481_c3_g1~~TRINITY_DN7481_c3_g1_i2.p3  ORF type:complete len:297 (+),score=48.58 TRINITY_DN7481_c3_g1_i2:123-1013(+)
MQHNNFFRPPTQAAPNPNFHPAACNICGQLGHQAVNCSIGTIRWKDIYGEDAFIIRPPLYWSEIQEKRKRKKVDMQDLEKRAREFAQQTATTLGLDYNKMMQEAAQSVAAKEKLEEMKREREAMGLINQYQQEDEDEELENGHKSEQGQQSASQNHQNQIEAAQQQLAQMNPSGQQQQFMQMQQPQQVFVGVQQPAQPNFVQGMQNDGVQQPVQQPFPQVQQQGQPQSQQQQQPAQQQPVQQQQTGQPLSQPVQQQPADLPEGWAAAQDQQGRVYYWHRKTHKTQWEKPTEETPIQ